MEIEKLKLLLLDKDQYHLFNYIPKPMLGDFDAHFESSASDFKRMWNLAHMPEEERLKLTFEAFVNIKEKIEKNDIDKKLLDVIESED
jgi:hypothetical protein